MMSLWVDFNEVFDGDYVWTSLRRSGPQLATPNVGEWVVLHDDDGATCLGIITSVVGPIVTCKLDWSEWREVQDSLRLDAQSPVSGLTLGEYYQSPHPKNDSEATVALSTRG